MTHHPDAKYHHFISASNPYRNAGDLAFQPPAWARAGEYTNDPHPSEQLIEAKGAMGNGWAMYCSPCTQPTVRSWTNEQKARNRRLRLWRRLQKRAPLFALGFFLEFTEAQPGYYYRAENPRLLPLSGQHDQPTRRTPVGNDQPALLSPFPPIRDLSDYQRLINSGTHPHHPTARKPNPETSTRSRTTGDPRLRSSACSPPLEPPGQPPTSQAIRADHPTVINERSGGWINR